MSELASCSECGNSVLVADGRAGDFQGLCNECLKKKR